MMALKTNRNELVSAFTKMRLPTTDPVSTPSITGMSYARTSREVSRVKQDESENRGDCAAGHSGGEECSQQRADGGGDLEKHSDPDVGKPFFHIGGSRAGRSRDHRYQRGADCVADINFKK